MEAGDRDWGPLGQALGLIGGQAGAGAVQGNLLQQVMGLPQQQQQDAIAQFFPQMAKDRIERGKVDVANLKQQLLEQKMAQEQQKESQRERYRLKLDAEDSGEQAQEQGFDGDPQETPILDPGMQDTQEQSADWQTTRMEQIQELDESQPQPEVTPEQRQASQRTAVSIAPTVKQLENQYVERASILGKDDPRSVTAKRKWEDARRESQQQAKDRPATPQVQQAIAGFVTDPTNKNISDEEYYANVINSGIPSTYAEQLLQDRQRTRQNTSEDQRARWRETSDYRQKISNRYAASQEKDAVLGRLTDLNDTGELTSPLLEWGLRKLGVPLGILKNPESEEFQKASQQLVGLYMEETGGRILASQMQNFFQRVPTLANSEEGRKAIIRNLELFESFSKADFNEMRKIMRESDDGAPPFDLAEQVAENVTTEKKRLTDEFNKQFEMVEVVAPRTMEQGGKRITKGTILPIPRMDLPFAEHDGWELNNRE